MYVIGLTGSLGTGKSTVAKLFSEKGARIINADRIAHQAIRKDGLAFNKVLRAFGTEVFIRGGIDRRRLAAIVFNDKTKLKKLEKIIHPIVEQTIVEKLSRYSKGRKTVVVLDVPLLFESGFDRFADINIVVRANKNIQIQRAMHHLKITRAEAIRRINAQMSLREKIQLADVVIKNSGTFTQTRKQVDQIWLRIQQK